MKAPLRYRLLFLALMLLLGLFLLNPALLFIYIIDPLTRITWLIIRTLLVIDQGVYWVLLIFAAFLFILRIIPTRPEAPLRPAYTDTVQPDDRLAYWEGLLRSAEDHTDARSTLQQELSHLKQSLQARTEEAVPLVIDLPPVPNTTRHRMETAIRASFLFQSLRKPGGQPNSLLAKRVESILKSLENQLEINHD